MINTVYCINQNKLLIFVLGFQITKFLSAPKLFSDTNMEAKGKLNYNSI